MNSFNIFYKRNISILIKYNIIVNILGELEYSDADNVNIK